MAVATKKTRVSKSKAVSKNISSKSNKSTTGGGSKKTKKKSLKITFSKRKLLLVVFSPLLLSILLVLGYKYRGEFIVATVNGKPITRIELWKSLEQQGGTQSLEALITQELIAQEGAKQNIIIAQQDIDTELQNIEETVSAQGLTLEQALEAQNMTKKKLEEQIKLQKTLEKLVADKVVVTENEVNEALSQTLESGQEDSPELREQIKTQLEQTKSSQAIQEYLANVRQNSKIDILNSNFADAAQNLN